MPLALVKTLHFTVLSINVLYRGSGIPVAWKIVKATEKGSWKPHWLELFQWMVTLGGEPEISSNEQLIGNCFSSSQSTPTRKRLSEDFSSVACEPRQISCFLNGLLTVVAQLLNGQSISLGRLFPLPLSHFNNLAFSNSS